MKPKLFLIIKDRSERVKKKNFRPIQGVPLHEYFMAKRNAFDIYIDTDSDDILNFYQGDEWSHVHAYRRLQEHVDIEEQGNISPAPLMIERFAKTHLGPDDTIITSHLTSPFIQDETILSALELIGKHDSVCSVEPIQEFAVDRIGDAGQPINFDLERVVKTQSLEPIGVVKGAFFIIKAATFLSNGLQRISSNHYYYPISKIEAIDIDTEDDLIIADSIAGSLRDTV